jgi:hypothetical protein
MIENADGDRRTAIEIAPLALLAVVALLLFAKPLVRNEVLTFRDHLDYFQPLRFYTSTELKRAHLPLWNPYNASGEPWLANPQTGVFYPPAWLFVPLPFAPAYVLFLAFHVALLGCGSFVLFRRFASRNAALIAALSFMICGPSLSLLDVSNTLTTLAWIPLVLWCAVSMAPPAVCAMAIAMSFLAGEPFFAAVGALMFATLRRRNLLDIALTSFCLCGVQLLPFLAFVRESDRAGGVLPHEILRHSMALSDWVRIVVPPPFLPAAPQQQFVPVVYVGMAATVLALVAIAAAPRRRAVKLAVVLVAASAIIAAGGHFAPSGFLLTHLPLAILRYPARTIPLVALGLHALAAIGWDVVARKMRSRWAPIVVAAIVIADLTPAIAPFLESAAFEPHPGPYAPLIARDGKLIRLMSVPIEKRVFDRHAWISGYLNLFERRFDAWTAAPAVSRRYVATYATALARREQFDALGVKWAISDRIVGGLTLIARWRDVLLYRNDSMRPLAYWRGDDGRVVPVTLLAFKSSAVNVEVNAPADGTLIVSQQSASGWRVFVDGQRADAVSDQDFRAVRITKGPHAVEWRYRPTSFVAGVVLTLVAILRMLLSKIFVKTRVAEKLFFRAHF